MAFKFVSRPVLVVGLFLGAVGIFCSLRPAHSQALVITQSGNLQVTAVVPFSLPTSPAIITSPADQSRFTTTPLVVRGSCQSSMLVRIYNNSILAGSMTCSNDNDFVINITLEIGNNTLTALNFNADDNAGPVSPAVNVIVTPVLSSPSRPIIDSEEITPTGDVVGPFSQGVSLGAESDSQRLFEGTFIAPMAKVAGVSTTVSPSINHNLNLAFNGAFMVVLLILGLLLLL